MLGWVIWRRCSAGSTMRWSRSWRTSARPRALLSTPQRRSGFCLFVAVCFAYCFHFASPLSIVLICFCPFSFLDPGARQVAREGRCERAEGPRTRRGRPGQARSLRLTYVMWSWYQYDWWPLDLYTEIPTDIDVDSMCVCFNVDKRFGKNSESTFRFPFESHLNSELNPLKLNENTQGTMQAFEIGGESSEKWTVLPSSNVFHTHKINCIL